MERLAIVLLVAVMVALALALARQRNLVAIAVLSGAYSLTAAAAMSLLDAIDVAFTEAAVGAGISLSLMLAAIALAARRGHTGGGIELGAPHNGRRAAALVAALVTGGALLYAATGLPPLGDAAAPIHGHIGARFIAEGPLATGIPNMVTSVLASYRGYDTLGEVTVIFAAGVAVMALLRRPGEKA